MYRFVVKRTYIDLLSSLENGETGLRECSKKIGMNYYHLSQVIEQLHKEKVVKKERQDVAYAVSLTEKGKKIVRCLRVLKSLIEDHPVSDPLEEENRQLRDQLAQIQELDKDNEVEKDAAK